MEMTLNSNFIAIENDLLAIIDGGGSNLSNSSTWGNLSELALALFPFGRTSTYTINIPIASYYLNYDPYAIV